MSISIIVRRGAGSHPGDDIIDPLITTIPVALARGRNELDQQASGLQEEEVVIPFRIGVRVGQVAQVQEVLFGTTWYGKIIGVRHNWQLADAETTLRLNKPTSFAV